MLQLQQAFTDVHGITHSAAVVVVRNIGYNVNHHISVNAEIAPDGVVTYSTVLPTGYINLQFGAYLYPSIEALQAGKQPLQLCAADGRGNFTVQPTQALTEDQLVAYCEQWLLDHVINEPISVPEVA